MAVHDNLIYESGTPCYAGEYQLSKGPHVIITKRNGERYPNHSSDLTGIQMVSAIRVDVHSS